MGSVLGLLFLSPLTKAQNQLDAVTHADSVAKLEPIINTGSLIQVVLSLVLVIGVIYLLAWYLRRQQSSIGLSQNMRVIAALSVGTRERVVLVQLADKQLLLGVGSGSVNLLQAFDEPVLKGHEHGQHSTFARLLARHLQSSNGNKVESDRS